MSATLERLLFARAYMVSVDPALVTISVEELMVAISGLQLLLSILAAILAGAAWLALSFFTDAYWSSTFLASGDKKSKPGYVHNPPSVEPLSGRDGAFIAVAGKAVVPQDRQLNGFLATDQWRWGDQPVPYYSQVPGYADTHLLLEQRKDEQKQTSAY
ncbi:hypothetical protein NW756_012736 [Fusarium oxysporum]|uniref:Uncharacterized protein n=1 Tax=Fusarium oxysporum f. sp. pisi HDV247 TaxID=1080344 RepID=W9Q3K2_FUSOX|nr:hypothetical protein FOVG_07127 [Fusarium oxysporum f. sp. pisi HDV247]KAJ4027544.1 hypothetical protein NW753_014512 [Fusarium oxysporum]WKT43859.1 hypothetical protein QSH57_008712 [Fusarium oxysporum f. sp. vasinfectum]KAJ4030282.1 hypothetical protein NW758_013109 [Fusarium oxysporum]KAJ4048505.1 hypothetical protein NW763_009919 [Fusarium oxysporum]